MQQGPIAKVLVQLLVTMCAARERLPNGNYAKGHIKDKSDIQDESRLSDNISSLGPETFESK